MNKEFYQRIKYYAVIVCVAIIMALYPTFTAPYVEGDVLRYAFPNTAGEVITHEDPQWDNIVQLVNLWGMWCGPCRQEMPYLVKLQEKYKGQGFEIIGIEFPAYTNSTEEEHQASLEEFKNQMGVNYTLLTAGSPEKINEWVPDLRNVKGFPTSLFINRDGKVTHITTGFHPADIPAYEKRIQALLAE